MDYWKTKFDSIIVIDTKNINLAVSRNIGLSYCSVDIILQTDDDARPYADWISNMIKFHKKFESKRFNLDYDLDGLVYKVNNLARDQEHRSELRSLGIWK